MKNLKMHLLIGGFALLAACGPSNKEDAGKDQEVTAAETEEPAVEEEVLNTAKAVISSASGSSLTGEATFTDLGNGDVTLKLTVENATPGEHALHLHEIGDCSAPDAKSAGGHWNPAKVKHGERAADQQYHAGDIANLEVGEDGKGELTATVSGWTIGGPDSTSIIDKAVVIHAQADDFTSQPSGAAGKRVGCGVIQKD
ncbi:superoxide dismutase family protein [Fulvivirga sp. 29W222]|uniref:Superoxide dismutase family protein n=1 Tax=Fulvivirga marina TaxID=2494733 RepID=A0A937FWC7_9BACT|nr:superoxide dismutase family protein [Fulvivirga marina]MBL6445842.1 superoxide dismutase family protein [Fulvivirga marina]